MSMPLTAFPWTLSTSLSGFNFRLRTLWDTENEGCALIDAPYNYFRGKVTIYIFIYMTLRFLLPSR